jgi:hypothetical protein
MDFTLYHSQGLSRFGETSAIEFVSVKKERIGNEYLPPGAGFFDSFWA